MNDFRILPVQVMAVSKFQSIEAIQSLIDQGYTLFGENRVQEVESKWPALLAENHACQLHLIGPLQTNKVSQALQLFHGIESIDRVRLVDEIMKYLPQVKCRTTEFLIQVNIGREPQKSGVLPEEFDGLFAYCLKRGLPVSGVMCIPPVGLDPVRYFNEVYQLAVTHNLPVKSMGMSGDYEVAMACGSTRIRLGTALFGPRSE